jgi:hypothetical protein
MGVFCYGQNWNLRCKMPLGQHSNACCTWHFFGRAIRRLR